MYIRLYPLMWQGLYFPYIEVCMKNIDLEEHGGGPFLRTTPSSSAVGGHTSNCESGTNVKS